MNVQRVLGLLAWLVLGIACGQADAQRVETIPLWPAGTWPATVRGPEQVGRDGSATGAVSRVSEARIEIHHAATPNGSGALILGGGGYFRIQVGSAARPMAQWLASIGTTSAVLYYRLPADGWPAAAPFQDAQRAMRLLRSRAAELGLDPARIGIIGSSAGANAAGIIATRWEHAFYPPRDAVDALSARPDFLGMIYPVVSVQAPLDKTRTARELATQADYREAYSVETHVRRDMPPVFLAQAVDDPTVDVGHSLAMLGAARAAGVPVEMHLFERGGHSWGLGTPGTAVAQWPRLFATWARQHGVLGAPPSRLQPIGAPPWAAPAATPPATDTPDSDSDDGD